MLSILLVTGSLYLYNVPHATPAPTPATATATAADTSYTAVQLEEATEEGAIELGKTGDELHRR